MDDKGFGRFVVVLIGLTFGPAALLLRAAVQADASTSQATVAFVGCQSDGQLGPRPAPDVPDRVIWIDAAAARQLTYYKAENGPGVLGPKGWNCFGFYGSSGSFILVTPGSLSAADLNPSPAGISGPAIQLSQRSGETSGRFDVAQVVARVFPAQRNFVQHVIDEGIEPANNFPFGAYPTDRLVYRHDRVVEYETPAGAKGLGTMSRLEAGGDPIRGVAILQNQAPDLLLLTMRLPSNIGALATSIIQQVEQTP